MQLITSVKNEKIRLLRGLGDKKQRQESGLFLVEGEKLIREALECGRVPQLALFTRESGADPALLTELERAGCEVIETVPGVIDSVCDTKTPQGLAAAVPMKEWDDTDENGRTAVVLDGVSDPGNVGTVLRTAEAMGVDTVFLCGCADLYNPKVVRSTMGAIFRQRTIVCTDAADALSRLKSRGYKLYAAALGGARDIRRADFSGRSAIVIGSEAHGVSAAAVEMCDERVLIPMQGRTESLNAGVAAAICMWELCGRGCV